MRPSELPHPPHEIRALEPALCERCQRPLLTRPGPLCDPCQEKLLDLADDARAEIEDGCA